MNHEEDLAPLTAPRWEVVESALAPYAMRSSSSRGRKFPEAEHPYRSPFMRDRDRVLHSTAFRRLMHKTQVYIGPPNDHQRTRLTHTLEVTQIARTAARALGLNEDLAEAIALAHDIGHPPFGHAGERALDAKLIDHGGFEHNRHALRRVTLLEERSPQFPGLNLSFEVLEALAARSHDPTHPDASEFTTNGKQTAECQLVDECDSIAYDAHDVDDALRAGLLRLTDLRTLELWREAEEGARAAAGGGELEENALARGATRWLIDALTTSLIDESGRRLANTATSQAVRCSTAEVAALCAMRAAQKRELEQFLFERVYRNEQVVKATWNAEKMIGRLFDAFIGDPSLLPFRAGAASESASALVRDYIAGMTDRFAQRAFREIVGRRSI